MVPKLAVRASRAGPACHLRPGPRSAGVRTSNSARSYGTSMNRGVWCFGATLPPWVRQALPSVPGLSGTRRPRPRRPARRDRSCHITCREPCCENTVLRGFRERRSGRNRSRLGGWAGCLNAALPRVTATRGGNHQMWSVGAMGLAPCQCPTRTAELRACHRTATAEDLRCDLCRVGCRVIWAGAIRAASRRTPDGGLPPASGLTRRTKR